MKKAGLATLIATAMLANAAMAKVGADQAKNLGLTGTSLTPLGAERAGNADGSPLPCEVALETLRTAAAGRTPTDQAKYDQLLGKGLERCNADDDKRADGFFADAYALLG